MNETFTPLPALLGGMIIGLAVSLAWLLRGRVAGISGLASGALLGGDDRGFALRFTAGLVGAGALLVVFVPAAFANTVSRPLPWLVGAGLLVGFGTRLARGCTSGHGIAGIARLRPRSIVATLTFMATGAVTVWLGVGS
jgi:uncharacterized membrane protein YedE/YeeE